MQEINSADHFIPESINSHSISHKKNQLPVLLPYSIISSANRLVPGSPQSPFKKSRKESTRQVIGPKRNQLPGQFVSIILVPSRTRTLSQCLLASSSVIVQLSINPTPQSL